MNRKEGLLLWLIVLIAVFNVVGHMPVLLAYHNSDSSGSNSGSSDVNDNSGSSDDDFGDKEDDADDENANDKSDVRVKERIKEENGKVEREFKKEITTANGKKIEIERKIKIKNGEVEIKTKLKVDGKGSNLSVLDSEGIKHKVKVTPEKIKIFVRERLNSKNITDFSLDEIEHKNIPRIVYKIQSDHPGRFLGVFKLAIKSETQIDPETGEVINVNVPWWAFLITGTEIPNLDEVIGNETLENEIIATNEELEEEFDDVKIDEELEIKAESFNGTSKVKIELEFDTKTTQQKQIINEILDRLSNLNISSLVEIEESDEPLKNKDKLKVKIESEDGLTEVEFELKFFINTDLRDNIVSAIVNRLSSLTAEDINTALTLEIEDDDFNEDEVENENETEEDELEEEN